MEGSIMKKRIDGQVVVFTFDDGVPEYRFDTSTLSEANRAYVVPFGMSHRLGDNAAINRKDVPGGIVTEKMRRAAVAELGDFYATGTAEWDMRGGTRAPTQNAAILALAAALGKTYGETEAFIASGAIAGLMGKPADEPNDEPNETDEPVDETAE